MLAPTFASRPNRFTALRFTWRDLRGGVRGFAVFVACIALGVAAIAGVGSVAANLGDGIANAGQTTLSGDLAFSLIQRQANDAERAFLDAHGTVSAAATLRAMARTAGGQMTLVELKAVDSAYPLFGSVVTDPDLVLPALFAEKSGAFGAAVDPALLARLNLKTGDRITIGNATIELRAALITEPDKLSGGVGLGPRVLVSDAALRASGLVQPGSLVRWQYRLRLPPGASDGAVAALDRQAQAQFPEAGWEIRTRDKATPQLERNIERVTEFLTLVALATLLVGGVGVANAVAAHLSRKRDAIGTMKALGASGGNVFAIYCAEIVLVAAFAAAIGAVLGALSPFAIAAWLKTIDAAAGRAVIASGRAGAVVRLRTIDGACLCAVAAGTRPRHFGIDAVSRPDRRRAAMAPPALCHRHGRGRCRVCGARRSHHLAASHRRDLHCVRGRHSARAAGSGAAGHGDRAPPAAAAVDDVAAGDRQHPPAGRAHADRHGLVRARPRAADDRDRNRRQSASRVHCRAARQGAVVLLSRHSGGRRRSVSTPSCAAQAPDATLERVPMLRGRIVSANGIKADDLKPGAGSRWVLRGDRGITYAAAVPAGSRVVAGQWWSANYSGDPLVSLESKTAHDLDLKIGETITVNVLGRNITARIANLRAVDWENLGINFVLVFSPGAFAGAPHSDIATLTFADGGTAAEEAAIVKALAGAFPTVTAIGVKDALTTLDALIGNLVLALRAASAVTLVGRCAGARRRARRQPAFSHL